MLDEAKRIFEQFAGDVAVKTLESVATAEIDPGLPPQARMACPGAPRVLRARPARGPRGPPGHEHARAART